MLHLISFLTAQPGQREVLLTLFRENMPKVHAEPGCLSYQPFVDAPDMGPMHANTGADTLVTLEIWADKEALRRHVQAPHMVEFLARIQPLLAGLSANILEPA